MPSPHPQLAGATMEPWQIVVIVLVVITLAIVGLVKLIRRR
jgi:hypothetical protein